MSTSERKLGFHEFMFLQKEPFFEKENFISLINYVDSLPTTDKIIRNEKTYKAISFDSCAYVEDEGTPYFHIIFKSCKYNHCPDYMSSHDGQERRSQKQLHEGEKEKTHLCIKIEEDFALAVIEERKTGVTITQITNYLSDKLRDYLRAQGTTPTYRVIYSRIPVDGFLETISTMSDIKIAEVFTNKMLIGSEAMNLLDREEAAVQDDIMVTLKAKRKESIAKRTIRRIYEIFVSTDNRLSRVRVQGKDGDGYPVRLDTDKLMKAEYIIAELDENGIVISDDIFRKIMNVLKE